MCYPYFGGICQSGKSCNPLSCDDLKAHLMRGWMVNQCELVFFRKSSSRIMMRRFPSLLFDRSITCYFMGVLIFKRFKGLNDDSLSELLKELISRNLADK